MVNKKTIISIVILLLLIAGIISMNLTGLIIKNNDKVIKIGVVATQTGVGAYPGQEEIRGIELAVEEINDKGGINGKQVRLIIEDSAAAPDKAVEAVHKLIDADGVKYIIGDSWSSTTVAMVPITNEENVILISPIAILDELSEDDMFFRTIPTTDGMMKELAEYAYNNMGARRVAVLRQATPFGVEHTQDFKKYFEKLGGEVVAEESFPLTQNDVRTEITKVMQKEPDTIFNIHATGPPIGLLIKQAKELDVDVKWISSFGVQNDPLVKAYKNEVEGLVYAYPDDSRLDNDKTGFVSRYKEKYNETPSLYAANSYDAMIVLSKAIEHSGEDSAEIKKYLLNMQEHKGASGNFKFDENGDIDKTIIIKTVRDGKFVEVN
jgi:branched-chain amino acid transport system substrate-binding protein